MLIYILGMPASGKTTFGRGLAHALGYRFLDLDEEIVRREKMPVAEIFQTKGEEYFRRKEEMKDRENHYLFTFLPVYNICKEAYSTIGREYKEETRIKHKQYAKENNIKPPKETYEGRYIPIIQLNKETGEEIEEFKSVSEACFAIGKNYKFVSTLTDVCRGKRKSAFGYKWKFKNGSEIKINNSECGS